MKLKITEIKPNPDNPRLIKDDKFKKLVQSLKDFPEMAEVREVVVNKDHMILGGNMRFKAAQEAGWKEIPVKVVDWPEDKQREFIIKDNVSGGEWDWDIIANEWDQDLLEEWGLELPTGFGDSDVEEDTAPEVSKDPPQSALGAVYQLGRHRLMCGDSTDFGAVSDLMDGADADMVLTDPPYGKKASKGTNGLGVAANRRYTDDWDNFAPTQEYFDEMRRVSRNQIIFGGNYFADKLPVSNCWLVWDKIGNLKFNNPFAQAELAWTSFNKTVRKYTVIAQGFVKDSNDETEHPTQKPTELLKQILRDFAEGTILDPFAGSGSTLIACEQLDRTCYMMELDPKYCDVIRKRYWKFTHDNNEEGWEEGTPIISERAAKNA